MTLEQAEGEVSYGREDENDDDDGEDRLQVAMRKVEQLRVGADRVLKSGDEPGAQQVVKAADGLQREAEASYLQKHSPAAYAEWQLRRRQAGFDDF